MISFVAAAVIAAVPSAAPAATPVTTVLLNYGRPPHGYRANTDLTSGGVQFKVATLADAAGNRDVDAQIVGKDGRALRQEYLFMDGIAYVKAGDDTWMLTKDLPPAFTQVLMNAGSYPSALMLSEGRVVHREGDAPCGSATCSVYTTTRVAKVNEKPTVTISHLSIDKTTNQLSSIDSRVVDASNNVISKYRSDFDPSPQRLEVPVIAESTTPTCYLSSTPVGTINLCLYKGTYTADVYTISVDGKLALRTSETVAAVGVMSPVIDGLTLRCAVGRQSNAVDPNLAATLKQSGMTDDQIAEQLGQKAVASDCTVNSGGATVMTQHFDLK